VHNLLKRQIAKSFQGVENIPDNFHAFIQAVDNAYKESDIDRTMLEHTLELSSQELLQSNGEMRLLQHKLQQRNRELEETFANLKLMQNSLIQSEKMASIGQLTAGIAHEINNPLAFVSSNLNRFHEYFFEVNGLLSNWHQLVPELDDCPSCRERVQGLFEKEDHVDLKFMVEDFSVLMKHTLDGVERIKNIVAQLRGFSHLAASNFALADVNEIIEESILLTWNELKYKATIHKEYGMVPQILCNAVEIKQVFVNLLVNAAHAITQTGTISILTEVHDQSIMIRLSDTGSGISKDNLTKIFNPFFTTKPVGKGTGLGLWITLTIIERHNGSISVKSSEGAGTTFTLTLPIVQIKT
jgi:two-component system NtrC family sensor kinase